MEIITLILKEILKFQYIILPSIVLSVMSLEKRRHFFLRSIFGLSTYLAGSYFIYLLFIPVPELFGAVDVSYILMLALAVGCVLFCFRARVKTIMFFTMSAYVVQNAAYNLLRIIIAVCHVEYRGTTGLWIQFFVYILSYIVYYFLFIRRLKDAEDIDWENRLIVVIVTFTLVMVYVLSSFLTVYLTDKGTEILVISRLYAMIACLLDLIMQYTLCDKSKREKENEILERLLSQEEKQHERTKENIDLINRKCHDLKHQILAFKREEIGVDKEYIAELENAVAEYDGNVNTGNSSLDIILTEKNMYCHNHGIHFTFVLDGEALSFMKDSDIYSLFGNALDNAVECVEKEIQPEKRVINMNISRRGEFSRVRVENYCEKKIHFENGLPVTTKEDNGYHGFGMKSIRYIAEKYGGTLSVGQKEDMFYLNILFPVQNQQNKKR